jgi:large subunit ribosomal protein L15
MAAKEKEKKEVKTINSKPLRVKNKKSKRVGRGPGSGKGMRSGRGDKGAGQRSGKTLPYAGFNGGNVPYFRKIPKRGFTSRSRKGYQIVNLKDISERLGSVQEVTPQTLKAKNLIKDDKKLVKILADGGDKFSLKATVKANKFSAKAKELIEKAGGTAECLAQ